MSLNVNARNAINFCWSAEGNVMFVQQLLTSFSNLAIRKIRVPETTENVLPFCSEYKVCANWFSISVEQGLASWTLRNTKWLEKSDTGLKSCYISYFWQRSLFSCCSLHCREESMVSGICKGDSFESWLKVCRTGPRIRVLQVTEEGQSQKEVPKEGNSNKVIIDKDETERSKIVLECEASVPITWTYLGYGVRLEMKWMKLNFFFIEKLIWSEIVETIRRSWEQEEFHRFQWHNDLHLLQLSDPLTIIGGVNREISVFRGRRKWEWGRKSVLNGRDFQLCGDFCYR